MQKHYLWLWCAAHTFPVLHNEGHLILVTFRWFVLCVHRMTTFVFVLWARVRNYVLKFFIIILRKLIIFIMIFIRPESEEKNIHMLSALLKCST